MKSRLGGFLTLLMYLVILMYALIKFQIFISRQNPNMSVYYQTNQEARDHVMNLNKRNFRIAVSIEDYYGIKKLKDDPKYVKWIFRIYGKKDN